MKTAREYMIEYLTNRGFNQYQMAQWITDRARFWNKLERDFKIEGFFATETGLIIKIRKVWIVYSLSAEVILDEDEPVDASMIPIDEDKEPFPI